jgi:hypothetical protein
VSAAARWPLSRLVALTIFAGLCFGALRPIFLRIHAIDSQKLHAGYTLMPDRQTPEYPRFLAEAAKRTERSSRVAILVPMRHWDGGYSYAYYRASYFLAGRQVLPLVWRKDEVLRDNIGKADYVAAWRMQLVAPQFEPVWQGEGGTLYRRRRS